MSTSTNQSTTVKPTMAIWTKSYFDSLTTKTKETRRKAIQKHVLPFLGAKELEQITDADITKIYAVMRQKGYAEGTVSDVDNNLYKIFQAAMERNLITINPIDSVNRPTFLPKEHRPLTEDEINRVKACIKESALGNLYIVIMETGMKTGEALAISWEDIDFRQNVIRIQKAFRNIVTAPVLENIIEKGIIYTMNANVITAIKAEKKQQEKKALLAGNYWNNTNNFVFTNCYGYPLQHPTLSAESKNMKRRTRINDFNLNRLHKEFKTQNTLN